MTKNPKDLYGINSPEKPLSWDYPAPIYMIYHYCQCCNNKWETMEKWTGKPIKREYDYCSECYKNS